MLTRQPAAHSAGASRKHFSVQCSSALRVAAGGKQRPAAAAGGNALQRAGAAVLSGVVAASLMLPGAGGDVFSCTLSLPATCSSRAAIYARCAASQLRESRGAAAACCNLLTAARSLLAGAASARLESVNRPDLLPKEFTTVIGGFTRISSLRQAPGPCYAFELFSSQPRQFSPAAAAAAHRSVIRRQRARRPLPQTSPASWPPVRRSASHLRSARSRQTPGSSCACSHRCVLETVLERMLCTVLEQLPRMPVAWQPHHVAAVLLKCPPHTSIPPPTRIRATPRRPASLCATTGLLTTTPSCLWRTPPLQTCEAARWGGTPHERFAACCLVMRHCTVVGTAVGA